MKLTWGILVGFLVFLTPAFIYLKTLSPTYIPIDSAEFALCMHYWGICHPPGFPLYVFLGKIFTSILPFGSLIFRANLFSAIFGALTTVIIYLILVELKLAKQTAAGFSILLGICQIFWEFSIAADVFTFGTFLISLTFLATFKGLRFLAFFALGLSASHFYITTVLFPLLIWYFATTPGEKQNFASPPNPKRHLEGEPKRHLLITQVSLAGLAFVLGFFPQLLLYLRMGQTPVINWGHSEGLGGFIDFVQRKEFGSIFLIANPVLTFSPVKLVNHFYVYFVSLLTNFGVVLPIAASIIIAFGRLFTERKILLLILSFWLLLVIQLTLLATIDPLDTNSPFQINKFYLPSFVIAIILISYSLNFLNQKLFGQEKTYLILLVGFLVAIYFLANFKTNNYSKNYLSQNLVLDSLEQLPQDSIAITVNHVAYFGGLYEQKINGRFKNIHLLYFPNEKNRDSEKYQRQVFANSPNLAFVNQVTKGKTIGDAERYILETISKNLDKPIYILQGTFEENFFAYLKPYIKPHGLWWMVEPKIAADINVDQNLKLFEKLRNRNVTLSKIHLKQQKDDLLTYAVAYHSTGIFLASLGMYDKAQDFLRLSLTIKSAENVSREIELIEKIKRDEAKLANYVKDQDQTKLADLGNNLFILGNYQRCITVFSEIVNFAPNDAKTLNNLASCYASYGNKQEARINYQKALGLDPNLDLAKKGLEALGSN